MNAPPSGLSSLRHNRIAFTEAPPEDRVPMQGIGALRIERTFPDRGTGWIDLSVLGDRPSLARTLAVGVQQVVDSCGSPDSLRTYRSSLAAFAKVLNEREAAGGAPIKKLADITVPALVELSDALLAKGSSTGYAQLSHIKRFFREIENVNPGTYPQDVLQHLSFVAMGSTPKVEHKPPYSDREAHLIERACRADIRRTIARLTTELDSLRKNGKDPRRIGWTGLASAVWCFENMLEGKYISASRMKRLSSGRWCTTADVFRAVYPTVEDAVPFYLRLCLKTGLNAESAMRLKRDCLEPETTQPNETRLRYVKGRSEGPMTMPVRTDGTFSPGGLIRMYLHLTRGCAELTGDNSLWLVAKTAQASVDDFIAAPSPATFTRAVRAFAERHGLTADNGEPLELRADRLRTTRKTLDYRRANGDLIFAGHDHRRDNTTVDYINNRVTEEVHNQAIVAGQQQFHAYFSGAVVPGGATAEDAAKAIGCDASAAETILNGQQEMLIANCKNMFDAPGGTSGQLCGKVWACFGCPNSVWTSRVLPKVLWYLDFFLEQRRVIPESEWEKKFGYPYALITSHILPAFSQGAVAQAKLEAASLRMYVPPEMKAT